MRSLLMVLCIGVATQAWAEPLTFVAPGLRVTGLKGSLAQDFSDHLAQQLTARGLKVISSSDIGAVLSAERQRQLLGCAEASSSCAIELVGALGADGLLNGSVTKTGRRVQISVRLIDSRSAKVLATASQSVDSDEQIFDALDLAAQELLLNLQPLIAERRAAERKAAQATAAPELVTTTAPTEPAPGARRFWWIPTAAAVGLGVVAGISFAQGLSISATLRSGVPPPGLVSAEQLRADGEGAIVRAWIFTGLTAAAATSAVLLWILGEPAPSASVTLLVAPGGVHAGFGGRLPW